MKPNNLRNHIICSAHQNALLDFWRRKNNCSLCVDVFKKSKRSTSSLQRVTKALAIRIWNERRLNVLVLVNLFDFENICWTSRYNSWACTQCRKRCTVEFDKTDDASCFPWIYDERNYYTPSIAGDIFSPRDNVYEPEIHDCFSHDKEDGKKEFRQWLESTNYRGRSRGTVNYSALHKHEQARFRNQMKSIFHHILQQFASTDADVVWDDIIDDELAKPKTTKGAYVIAQFAALFQNRDDLSYHFVAISGIITLSSRRWRTHIIKQNIGARKDNYCRLLQLICQHVCSKLNFLI